MSDIIQSTTQQFLDIYDITNNFVIMKNGTVSTILTVDAMNFGLLAEEEQDAIMYAYAGLLNSLNYTVQIIIHSQTKDVTSYLKVLQEQELIAETETLRRRIRMYREFVGNLIHERNVLDKKFYVVIPASALEMGFLATSSILPGSKEFDISTVERSLIIEKAQNLLDPKRDHLIAQFARIGLYSRQLSTQEIIQLFYIRYNPEAVEGQQIGESTSYSTPLVKASIQETFMNTAPTQPPVAPQQDMAPPEPSYTQTVAVENNTFETMPVPEIHIAAPETVSELSNSSPLPAVDTVPEPPVAPQQDMAPPEPSYTQTVAVENNTFETMPVPEIHIAAPETVSELSNSSPLPAVDTVPEPPVAQTPVYQQAPPPTPPPAAYEAPPEPVAPVAPPSFSPAVTPSMPPMPPESAAPPAPSEADIQKELDATLQSLSTEPATATSEINPALKNDPASDLPPLPEI